MPKFPVRCSFCRAWWVVCFQQGPLLGRITPSMLHILGITLLTANRGYQLIWVSVASSVGNVSIYIICGCNWVLQSSYWHINITPVPILTMKIRKIAALGRAPFLDLSKTSHVGGFDKISCGLSRQLLQENFNEIMFGISWLNLYSLHLRQLLKHSSSLPIIIKHWYWRGRGRNLGPTTLTRGSKSSFLW